MSAVSTYLET